MSRKDHSSSAHQASIGSTTLGKSDVDRKQPVGDVSKVPCKVTEVQLKGLELTNPEIVHRELSSVLEASNLDEVYTEIQKLIPILGELDVFKTMEVHITETQKAETGKCRLEFDFVEKRAWFGRAKTFVQGVEAGVEGRIGFRNVNGTADKITLFMDYGSHKTMESALEYVQPRFKDTSLTFVAKISNSSRSNRHFSAYEEALKSIFLGLLSPDKKHSAGYEFGWQKLMDPQLTASFPVQQQLGNKLKSSLKYQYLHDEREHRHLSSGSAFRWNSELNGLYPHDSVLTSFKNKLDFQLSWKCCSWMSLAVGASAGLIVPWVTDYAKSKTEIGDRFYLGGVDSLKGFHLNSIGPTAARRSSAPDQKRDYLGGDILCSAYASLNFFGRHRAQQPLGVYGHLFGNIGNVAPLSSFLTGSLKDSFQKFGREYRASIGLGIVLPTVLGNFEVNYALPMRFSEYDSIRSGLQMSFGTDPFTV